MFCADAGGNPAFSVDYKVSDPVLEYVNNLLTPPYLADELYEQLPTATSHSHHNAGP